MSTEAASTPHVDESKDPRSQRVVILEPPIGTSFYKRYTRTLTHDSVNIYNPWGATLTIDFYVYGANVRADDPNFSTKGGRVYVIIVHNVQPLLRSGGSANPPLQRLGYKMVYFQGQWSPRPNQFRHVRTMPGNDYTTTDDQNFTYKWDFQQTMNLFKSQGNDSQVFNAVNIEEATRRGWKHTLTTQPYECHYECNLETGVTSPLPPQIFGISLWEAQELEYLTMTAQTFTYNGEAHVMGTTNIGLDFSAGALEP